MHYLDEDPVQVIRKHREMLSEKYKTVEALLDYYDTVPSPEEYFARLDREEAEKKVEEKKSNSLRTA